MDLNTIRKITIQGEGQQSLDTLASSLNKVAAAQGGVASVTDIQTKRALSAADAYKRQTLAVVEGARAQDQLSRSVKTLDAAMAQGVVKSTAEYNQRLALLHQKYGQVGEATRAMEKATAGLTSAFGAVRNAVGALGLALGIGAMVAYGKAVFNTTADLQEQADQILGAGGNVEALQALRSIFLTNGISQEQGDKILQRLTRSLGEAAEGSQKAQDAFHKMGLGAKELAGTTADAALPLVAKKLLEIEDATKRAALETAIFGKSGQQLEAALKALAEGSMSQLIARAKELGLVIDADLIKKADDAKDKIAIAFAKLQVAIAPIVVEWGEGFAKLVGNIDKVTKSLTDLWEKTKLFGGAALGARVGFAVGGIPGAVVGGVAGLVAAGPTTNQLNSSVDRYNAQLMAGGLSPSEMAEITQRRDSALAQLNAGIGNTGFVTNASRNGVESVTSSATRSSGSTWAPTKEDLANAKKLEDSRNHVKAQDAEIARSAEEIAKMGINQLKTSIEYEQHQGKIAADTDKFLESLQTEVDLVGMSADERERYAAELEGIRVSEGKITDAQKAQIAATVTARQEAERWRGVVDDISGGFQDFFEDVLNNGKLSFSSLWDSIKQSFVRMLAYMATQALINPIIVPFVEAFGGSGGLSSLLGGGSGSGLGGIASLFGGGDSGGGLGSLFGGGGSILGGSGSLLSRLVPGAAIAYASSMLGTAIFGNKNDTALGGALLGLPGAFIGSLTGTSNHGAISNFTNGGLGNTLFKAGGGNNGAMATQASGTINAALQALKDAGVDVSLGNISGLSIGSDKSYVYDFAGGKQKLAGGEAGVQATVNAIFDRILGSASSGDSAVNDLLQKYGGLNSHNLAAFSTELQAQKQAKAQEEATKAADDASAALAVLVQGFNALGTSISDLAQTASDASRLAKQNANSWESARDAIYQASAALLISAPGLSPIDQYNNSRSQFDQLRNSAIGGNAGAAKDLAGFASQFLQSSFQYNGSTTAYGSDLGYVQNTLGSVGGFSEAQRSFAQRQADALDETVARLSAINDSIKEQSNQNTAGLETLRAAVAELTAEVKDGNLLAIHG